MNGVNFGSVTLNFFRGLMKVVTEKCLVIQ